MFCAAPGRPSRVWVTRPQPDADAFAADLRRLSIEPIVAPLMAMQAAVLDPQSVTASLATADLMIVTSRNAIRALQTLGLVGLIAAKRIIAVGPGTARLASELGCTAVSEAGGKAADIVLAVKELAAREAVGSGRLLYLRGEEVAFDLETALRAALPGCDVIPIVVYRMVPTGAPDAALSDQIQRDEIDTIALFSPRIARHYAERVTACGLRPAARRMIHYCLSSRVAEQISHLQPRQVVVPLKPNVQEMLAVMGGPTAQSMH